MAIYSVISGTGSYIPEKSVKNEDFLKTEFYENYDKKLDKPNQEIIDKFLEITTISERRYAEDHMLTSDIAFLAGEKAIENAAIDKESLDYIIVAHNFGDIQSGGNRTDNVPSLAARVKHKLGIENPYTVCYDILFGCPGWLQAFIQADYFIRSGDAKRALVIGADVLSRISDPHDRDSMLYADGAGAVILEGQESATPTGILGHVTRSDTQVYLNMLKMGPSFKSSGAVDLRFSHSSEVEAQDPNNLYLKMNGRRLYQYALTTVPKAIKAALDKCGVDIREVSKVLIHQANGKMDEAILQRLFALYNITNIPENVMPMSISYLGNSSVATLPTLFDLIMRENLTHTGEAVSDLDIENSDLKNSDLQKSNSPENSQVHTIKKGDKIVFASVGAGMNINALVYIA
ncbi:MAG: ketoacyl-ACP synthase III [Bacteroidales bacterium]|nr:ketoacyl-ACP synthase III [Bacteroidales bacterium]MDD4656642.1 ketoacyl-ACP synthase III [Bacteroidales bacterium]